MSNNSDFCKRNFKPAFMLLTILIIAIVFSAFFTPQNTNMTSKVYRNNKIRSRKAYPAKTKAIPAIDSITTATPQGGFKLIKQPTNNTTRLRGGNNSNVFNLVSANISPAVVSIHATGRAAVSNVPNQEGLRFVDPFAAGANFALHNASVKNVGSGIIIDRRGYILTCYHVVRHTRNLSVSVFGHINAVYPALVAAAAPQTDLALLKIEGTPLLPVAVLGDSDQVKVGDQVLALGSPFGLDQTVTQGIISSKRKSLIIEGARYGRMLQTDTPINQGSSGGPLVNMQSESIGLNTAIYGPGEVFSGTGFAIPINRIKIFLANNSTVFK